MEETIVNDWEVLNKSVCVADAFALLFERHKDLVYRLAWGFTQDAEMAKDITQEVFLRLYQKRGQWQPRGAFTTLVYKITFNTSRELQRRASRLVLHERPIELDDRVSTRPPPEGLNEAVRELPEQQRAVLILRLYEGKSGTRNRSRYRLS